MAITKTAQSILEKEAFLSPVTKMVTRTIPRFMKSLKNTQPGKTLKQELTSPFAVGFGALDIASGGDSVGGATTGAVGSAIGAAGTSSLLRKLRVPGAGLIGGLIGGAGGYTGGSSLGNKVAPGWKRGGAKITPMRGIPTALTSGGSALPSNSSPLGVLKRNQLQ